jgi:pantothenate kinase
MCAHAAHNLHAGYGGTDKIREINCTGGGAYKFRDIVKSKLGIQLVPCDEMRSMIRGLNFLLRNTKNEIFCFTNRTKKVCTHTQATRARMHALGAVVVKPRDLGRRDLSYLWRSRSSSAITRARYFPT